MFTGCTEPLGDTRGSLMSHNREAVVHPAARLLARAAQKRALSRDSEGMVHPAGLAMRDHLGAIFWACGNYAAASPSLF